jgi:hypothetical protein
MKLFELAFACHVYNGMTNFNKAYKDFLDKTNHDLDMGNENHREALLEWLNKWGNRLEGESHTEISKKLKSWYDEYERLLTLKTGKQLLDFSDKEIDGAGKAYDTLAKITFICSTAKGKGHRQIGHTCASKILFALRKDVYPIWDDAMRKKYSSEGCSTYSEYMKQSREELQELNEECQRNGIELSELPSLLDREGESLLKLLDEYRWVFITRKVVLPSVELQKWYQWAR